MAQRIVAQIAERGLKPGDPLASERAMLQEYQISRGTLREALRFLELQGVLTIKPGPRGGAIVHAPDERALASVIGLVLQFSGARYGTILEARLVLEPPLAALAAERATAAELTDIGESVARMNGGTVDNEYFLAENYTFHRLIIRASGNQLFEFLLSSIRQIIDGTAVGAQYSERRRAAIAAAHARIYVALSNRAPELAAREMRAHLQEWVDYTGHLASTPLRWDHVS